MLFAFWALTIFNDAFITSHDLEPNISLFLSLRGKKRKEERKKKERKEKGSRLDFSKEKKTNAALFSAAKTEFLRPLSFDESKQSNKQKVPFTSRVPRESCSMLVKRSQARLSRVSCLSCWRGRRREEGREGEREGEKRGRKEKKGGEG